MRFNQLMIILGISLLFLVTISPSTYAGEVTFLNSHNHIDSVNIDRVPTPEVKLRNGKVEVVWKGLGLYLGDTSSSSNMYEFDALQEDPVAKAKRAAVDSLLSVAKQKALIYINDQRKYQLSKKEIEGAWHRVRDDIANIVFSDDKKESEGFLFSYKQWLRFDLSIVFKAKPFERLLDKILAKAEQREERERIQREKRKRLDEERRIKEREEAERQVRLQNERLARLESKRLEAAERLANLNVVQWGDNQQQTNIEIPIKELMELYPELMQKHLYAMLEATLTNDLQDKVNILLLESAMITIPGGIFEMGDLTGNGEDNEKPAHRVEVKPFRMGKTEVPFTLYDSYLKATNQKAGDRKFERANDHGWGRGDRPAINVSWDDAQAFIQWLNEAAQPEKPYRLPTEAEWEYAARGGTETDYWWGNSIGSNNANCNGCGSPWDKKMTAPVASFQPNPYGLYDTVGNVWEWVEDCYSGTYNNAPSDGSAVARSGCFRVIRGGSWYSYPGYTRVSYRYWSWTSGRNNFLGFRLAQDL